MKYVSLTDSNKKSEENEIFNFSQKGKLKFKNCRFLPAETVFLTELLANIENYRVKFVPYKSIELQFSSLSGVNV